jgi:hypothetical protein
MMGHATKCRADEEAGFSDRIRSICSTTANLDSLELSCCLHSLEAPVGGRSFLRGIAAFECYQNEYQTALDRYVPHYTDTRGLLENFNTNPAKNQQKRPIPTLASM